MMRLFDVYKIMEFLIFSSYLVFIFLSVQIWFLWKDIDKKELKINTFINESFFKKNCIYVFAFTIFFMIHEFIEGTTLPNALLYFEFFEMMGFVTILLFSYDWYIALKTCAGKKSIPVELTDFTEY